MTTINLLPWRQALREERKKQFLIILGLSACLSLLIVVSIHMVYANSIQQQKASNAYLHKEIKQLDQQIKTIKTLRREKEKMLARMEVIQQLQHNRPNVVRLFDNLVRVVPGGVRYSSVKRRGQTLDISGKAESNTRVSKLMRNMSAAPSFTEPSLNIIRANEQDTAGNEKLFTLKVKQVIEKN